MHSAKQGTMEIQEDTKKSVEETVKQINGQLMDANLTLFKKELIQISASYLTNSNIGSLVTVGYFMWR